MEFSGAANRYDGRRAAPHTHVVCLECERIEDADELESDGAYASIEERTGYDITSHRLDYFGACPGCQTREPGAH